MKDAHWLGPGYLEVTKEGQPEKQSASGAEGKERALWLMSLKAFLGLENTSS